MIQIIRPASLAQPRAVLFDFDGTLSLIRTGWMEVMIPMMVEILAELRTGEAEADLTQGGRGLRLAAHRQGDHLSDDRAGRRSRSAAAARRSTRCNTSAAISTCSRT